MARHTIKIVLINGSVRPGNVTLKALQAVDAALGEREITCDLVDPAELNLPLPGKNTNNYPQFGR